MSSCPDANTAKVDQSHFWSQGSIHWDAHRIGWAITGSCTAVTALITVFTVLQHARNYHVPNQQRQIIRILYLPLVVAISKFCSYRFFREYTYYGLVEAVYESLTVNAFLFLIVAYFAETAAENTAEAAAQRKDKKPLPKPFCCWRYRPSKAYFFYTVKGLVMQYSLLRPLLSLVAIVCNVYGVFCERSYAPHFANVWLSAVNILSSSIASYALNWIYILVEEELDGRRARSKLFCLTFIWTFLVYQGLVLSVLQAYGVIKGTEFWTVSNVATGLNAMITTVEMVFVALVMGRYACRSREYESMGPKTAVWRALWDSINIADFVGEMYISMRFVWAYVSNEPGARSSRNGGAYLEDAFGMHLLLHWRPPPTGIRRNARFAVASTERTPR